MFSFMHVCQSFCPQGDFFTTPPPSVQLQTQPQPSVHTTSPSSVQGSTPTYQVPSHWTCPNLFNLNLTVKGPPYHQTGPNCSTWTSLHRDPSPRPVQICSLCSPHCQQADSWHSNEMPSCYLKFLTLYEEAHHAKFEENGNCH